MQVCLYSSLSQRSQSLPIVVTKVCQTGERYFNLSILIFCSTTLELPSIFRLALSPLTEAVVDWPFMHAFEPL